MPSLPCQSYAWRAPFAKQLPTLVHIGISQGVSHLVIGSPARLGNVPTRLGLQPTATRRGSRCYNIPVTSIIRSQHSISINMAMSEQQTRWECPYCSQVLPSRDHLKKHLELDRVCAATCVSSLHPSLLQTATHPQSSRPASASSPASKLSTSSARRGVFHHF